MFGELLYPDYRVLPFISLSDWSLIGEGKCGEGRGGAEVDLREDRPSSVLETNITPSNPASVLLVNIPLSLYTPISSQTILQTDTSSPESLIRNVAR